MKIFGIALLLLAALPLLHHWRARRDARWFFGNLSKQAPIRVLSREEDAALEPFRAALGIGRSVDVRLLEGPCIEHCTWMRGTRSAWRSIGMVKVLLPFNALEHAGASNRAEVVLGHGFAVVVRMGGFDIAAAGTRTLRTAATQISERCETEEERMHRRRPTTPWAASGLALAAGICSVLPQMDLGRWSWFALALGLAFAASAFLLYRRSALGTDAPQRVAHVRGRLSTLEMADPHESSFTHKVMLLGNDQRLDIDPAWLESRAIKAGRWLEAEVRLHDRRVLSLGPGWSLLADEQRFPPIPVARHLLMGTVAVISLVLLLWSGGTPLVEAQRAAELFGPAVLRTDAEPGTLLDKPPSPGDGVHLAADATCELVATEHQGRMLAAPDCRRLRWGGAALQVPPLVVAESILRLGSGNTLRVHWDPANGVFPAYQQVSGLDALRREMDHACADGLTNCESLRVELEALPQEDTALLSRWTVRRIKDAIDRSANAPILDSWAAATPGLLAAQRGGIVFTDAGREQRGELPTGNVRGDWENMRDAATRPRRSAVSGTLESHGSDGRTLWLEIDRGRPASGAVAGLAYCMGLCGALLLGLFQGAVLVRAVPLAISRDAAFASELKQRPAPRSSWSG